MNHSTPGLPVHHQLPEFTQTHVHRVSDAIQPSHPLSSLSPPALHLSQHQSLFKWVSSLHQVAKVLEFQLQHQSFQWIFRTDCSSHGAYKQWFLILGRPKSIMRMVIFTLLVPFQFFLLKTNQPLVTSNQPPTLSQLLSINMVILSLIHFDVSVQATFTLFSFILISALSLSFFVLFLFLDYSFLSLLWSCFCSLVRSLLPRLYFFFPPVVTH